MRYLTFCFFLYIKSLKSHVFYILSRSQFQLAILSTQQLPVTSGYCTGQLRSRAQQGLSKYLLNEWEDALVVKGRRHVESRQDLFSQKIEYAYEFVSTGNERRTSTGDRGTNTWRKAPEIVGRMQVERMRYVLLSHLL